MNDDLGRGMLDWPADRWASLDTLAADAVTESVVMRNFLEFREQPDARTVRIAGKNVTVVRIPQDFTFDMQTLEEADLKREIRIAAQNLARAEDIAVIQVMNLQNLQQSTNLMSGEFIRAKNTLRRQGVQQGFGIVVSAYALDELEREPVGVRSGLDRVERVVGTTVAQSNGFPFGGVNGIHAVLFQASPAAYEMVRAYGPRIRVRDVQDGTTVLLTLEEGIAVGELPPNRCLGIQYAPVQAAPPAPPAQLEQFAQMLVQLAQTVLPAQPAPPAQPEEVEEAEEAGEADDPE